MPDGGRLTIATGNVGAGRTRAGALAAGRLRPRHGGRHRHRHDAATCRARLRTLLHDQGSGQGHGLGLSQVYGFIKQSGGEVVIDSEAGEGTLVSIYLPAVVDDTERPAPRRSSGS